MTDKMTIGVLGAGTMGTGIAQVFAQAGHEVIIVDSNKNAVQKMQDAHVNTLNKLLEKQKISDSESQTIKERYHYSTDLNDFAACEVVVEAIVEKLDLKQAVFKELETIVSKECILASNTSSLSISSIASVLQAPERMIGVHFFNPAHIMPLVEIIPALQTHVNIVKKTRLLVEKWGKHGVVCKDTPGFIVNRIARPFYGEALRIYEEGIADFSTIDWAMTEIGGFKMGPFTLMDYIGNDVNYAVTQSVFESFYFDARYRPSITQKRYVEAGFLGRKTERGFYNYAPNAEKTEPHQDGKLGQQIVDRILAMLFNEAIDAFFLQIASREDIETAMTKGVNYPKGLLAWAEEKSLKHTFKILTELRRDYNDGQRYRPSFLLKKLVKQKINKIERIEC